MLATYSSCTAAWMWPVISTSCQGGRGARVGRSAAAWAEHAPLAQRAQALAGGQAARRPGAIADGRGTAHLHRGLRVGHQATGRLHGVLLQAADPAGHADGRLGQPLGVLVPGAALHGGVEPRGGAGRAYSVQQQRARHRRKQPVERRGGGRQPRRWRVEARGSTPPHSAGAPRSAGRGRACAASPLPRCRATAAAARSPLAAPRRRGRRGMRGAAGPRATTWWSCG